ncbi:Predicted N-acyltransferase, GNAT family [Acetitomaculum ruminis DSM 5522]|uniref:Predicted N-acyltransferase, GNAT family n=1 Tax=Acetitomaculum ruminis DSM 5522 TaxID=1120918 RepID=A0A1I0W6T1_9FIRM|nr:GNAT family N-acetyltransferase [Acetitomaculum ruminis]SFA84224.1 Predicted N-acyltransferase, GNAT family [Acetitomaculum ruminis DSM 5522]
MIKGVYLSVEDDMSQVKNIREKVFNEELKVPKEANTDGLDKMAMSVILDHEGKKVATGRMRFDGEEFIMDQVAVLKEERGQGYGDFVVRMLLDKVFMSNGTDINTDVVKGTEGFFETIGFWVTGEEFKDEKSGLTLVPMKAQKGKIKTQCQGHC